MLQLKRKGNDGITNLVRGDEPIELVIKWLDSYYVEMRNGKSELDDLYCSEVNINITD